MADRAEYLHELLALDLEDIIERCSKENWTCIGLGFEATHGFVVSYNTLRDKNPPGSTDYTLRKYLFEHYLVSRKISIEELAQVLDNNKVGMSDVAKYLRAGPFRNNSLCAKSSVKPSSVETQSSNNCAPSASVQKEVPTAPVTGSIDEPQEKGINRLLSANTATNDRALLLYESLDEHNRLFLRLTACLKIKKIELWLVHCIFCEAQVRQIIDYTEKEQLEMILLPLIEQNFVRFEVNMTVTVNPDVPNTSHDKSYMKKWIEILTSSNDRNLLHEQNEAKLKVFIQLAKYMATDLATEYLTALVQFLAGWRQVPFCELHLHCNLTPDQEALYDLAKALIGFNKCTHKSTDQAVVEEFFRSSRQAYMHFVTDDFTKAIAKLCYGKYLYIRGKLDEAYQLLEGAHSWHVKKLYENNPFAMHEEQYRALRDLQANATNNFSKQLLRANYNTSQKEYKHLEIEPAVTESLHCYTCALLHEKNYEEATLNLFYESLRNQLMHGAPVSYTIATMQGLLICIDNGRYRNFAFQLASSSSSPQSREDILMKLKILNKPETKSLFYGVQFLTVECSSPNGEKFKRVKSSSSGIKLIVWQLGNEYSLIVDEDEKIKQQH